MARGLKSSIVPEFVENANFLAGFHDKIQRDELPVGAATVESYNFMLDKDGKWTTRSGCKYLGAGLLSSSLIDSNTSGGDDPWKMSVVADYQGLGQTFRLSVDCKLRYVQFFLSKTNLPTGNAVAKVYATTGEYGSTAVPTGTALATSRDFDVSTLTGTLTATSLYFDGSDRITLTAETVYAIVLEYNGGAVNNYIEIDASLGGGAHAGNEVGSNDNLTSWISTDSEDIRFNLYCDIKDTGGCTSSAKLLRRDGVELPVVFYSTKSKYFHPDKNDWVLLETGLTTGLLWGKAMGEKSTDNVNYLILCNGTDNYRYWSGVTGLVSSVTANTIVLQGSVTLANLGFTATGSVSIDGVPYAYTGLSGQTFTGVTPDPAAAGIVEDDPVTQLPVANAALPKGNVMISYNGRIVIFASPSGVALTGGGSLLGSKLNVYDDFTFSASRVASEGYQLVMNEGSGNGLGIVHFEGGLALLKNNAVSLHKVTYDANDYPTIQPFLPYDETLSGHIGVVGKKAYFALRNQMFFVSPRKVINSLQRVANVDYPQALPFSDRIQNTVDDMGWDSETCAVGFNYTARFCGKADPDDDSPNKQLIYDQRFDCWWTPFLGQSVSSYFVYDGKLYGTLADSPDVIELDTGYTDFATDTANGNPINAKLTLGRMNNGTKTKQKREKRRFIEGWMSRAGTVAVTLTLNEGEKTLTGTITGSADGYFFQVNQGGSFGIEEFGVETFGGEWLTTTDIPDGIGHFRILFNYLSGSFWNAQISFETSSYFKLITNAPDTVISPVGIPPSLKTTMS